MAVRLNLSRKYSEQYGEELARKASYGDGTAKFKIADGRSETACGSAAKFNRYEYGGESAQQMVELSARAQGEQNGSLTVAYILKGK